MTLQPERILRELTELWVSLGQSDTATDGVLRACAMTLVVLADAREDPGEAGETLAALMREHPSRAIVVRVDPSPSATLEARVFAQCWMPFGSRRQICCEQIEIIAPAAALREVPAVVLPLVVADLPVVVWSRMPGGEYTEFASLATKTIVDSASAADLRQLHTARQVVADLAWTRLTRWRELIAQIFENPVYASELPNIDRLRIVRVRSAVPVSAWYLAAWLLLCLRKAGGDPRLSFEPGNLDGVELASEALTVSIGQVDGSAAEVRVNAITSRTVFAKPTHYSALREELSIAGRDPVYEEALALAAALAAEYNGSG